MKKPIGTPEDHPLVFSSSDLHRQPGASEKVDREFAASEQWRNDVCHADVDTVIAGSFLLESAHDGVLIVGQAEVPVTAECVRCLDSVSWTAPISVQQFFAYPEAEPDPEGESDEDVAIMDGDLLDMRPAFRDAVVLALPLTPTCADDCPGLCAECGFRMAEDPEHGHDRIDPRWSALAESRPAEPN